MTTVDVVYRYEVEPAAGAGGGELRGLREVYGVRQIGFQEKEKTVRVEYDSTRLSEPVVHNLLRRAGAGYCGASGAGGGASAGRGSLRRQADIQKRRSSHSAVCHARH